MQAFVKAVFIAVLAIVGYTSVSAHVAVVYRQRHKDCKDSGYAVVMAYETLGPIARLDCIHVVCSGCGTIPCKVPFTCSSGRHHQLVAAADMALERFGRGELTGGIYMNTSDGIVRATWVGSVEPTGDEVQNIHVTIE